MPNNSAVMRSPSPSPQTDASDGRPPVRGGMALVLIATGLVLGLTFNLTLPYEQDQGSKLAAVYKIVDARSCFSAITPPYHYKELQQPLYYLISAALFRATPLPPYGAMNLVSVLMGVIFMGSVCYVARKLHDVPYWISWLVLISMPMFVLPYTFSNELAVAMGFLLLAMAISLVRWRFKSIPVGVLLGLSAWSYLPVILLAPFFVLWTWLWPLSGMPWRSKTSYLLQVLAASGVTAGVFWAVLLRTLPGVFPFEEGARWLYRMAVFFYTPCPTILLLAVVAWVWYLPRRCPRALCYLASLLPLVFMPGIVSHKHLMVTLPALAIPAAILMAHVTRKWRVVCFSGLGLWYVVSITPFGLYGPVSGGDWFLPTNDGPCPTGSYVAFYKNVRLGMYQEQYKDEIDCVERGIDAAAVTDFGTRLGGVFNSHFIYPYLYAHHMTDSVRVDRCWPQLSMDPKESSVFIIRTTYLRPENMDNASIALLNDWLADGKFRVADAGSSEVFPAVIEAGESVPAGTSPELGKRILFAQNYAGRHGMVPAEVRDSTAFRPLYWVPAQAAKAISGSLLYADSQFAAFDHQVAEAAVWRMRLPYRLLAYQYPGVASAVTPCSGPPSSTGQSAETR